MSTLFCRKTMEMHKFKEILILHLYIFPIFGYSPVFPSPAYQSHPQRLSHCPHNKKRAPGTIAAYRVCWQLHHRVIRRRSFFHKNTPTILLSSNFYSFHAFYFSPGREEWLNQMTLYPAFSPYAAVLSSTIPWAIPGTVIPSLKLVLESSAPVGTKSTLFQMPSSSIFRI